MLHFNKLYGLWIFMFFLYLNDIKDGGRARFNYLCFMSKPKRGMALVWSSLTENLKQLEGWKWHETLPVSNVGTYIMSLRWICL